MLRPETSSRLRPLELTATVDSIAAWQLDDGMIPWFPGGPADPWNHDEAAMAPTAGGRRADAAPAHDRLDPTPPAHGATHPRHPKDGLLEPTPAPHRPASG